MPYVDVTFVRVELGGNAMLLLLSANSASPLTHAALWLLCCHIKNNTIIARDQNNFASDLNSIWIANEAWELQNFTFMYGQTDKLDTFWRFVWTLDETIHVCWYHRAELMTNMEIAIANNSNDRRTQLTTHSNKLMDESTSIIFDLILSNELYKCCVITWTVVYFWWM